MEKYPTNNNSNGMRLAATQIKPPQKSAIARGLMRGAAKIKAKRAEKKTQLAAEAYKQGKALQAYNDTAQIIDAALLSQWKQTLPVDRIVWYAKQLLDPSPNFYVRMPLYPQGRSYLRFFKSLITFEFPLQANCRNFFLCINPMGIAYCSADSPATPGFIVADTGYNPGIVTNNVVPTAANYRALDELVNTAGANLPPTAFDNAMTLAFHAEVEVVGLAPTNRRGVLTAIQDRAQHIQFFSNAAPDQAVINAYLNSYPLSFCEQADNKTTIDYSKLSDGRICYHHVPPGSYANYPALTPQIRASGNIQQNSNRFIVIGSGFTPPSAAGDATTVRVHITGLIQAEPDKSQYNSYPSTYSTCYINPDCVSRMLESRPEYYMHTKDKQPVILAAAAAEFKAKLAPLDSLPVDDFNN